MSVVKFAGIMMLLLPASAQAEWFKIGTSVHQADYFMDPARIKTVNGKRQAWAKVDHSRDRTVSYRESMRLFTFDCDKQTYKILYYSNTDSYGKIIDSHSFTDSSYGFGYDPIVPESMAETVGKVACFKASEGTGS